MERSTRGLRESTHYYCATALRLVEVDGEHLGSHLWRGASLLAKWLEQSFERGELKGCRAIELGAGTGLVSMVAALRGATVVATERSDVMALLEQNIQANIDVLGKVQVLPLDWGTSD